jgi:hypothetical protein
MKIAYGDNLYLKLLEEQGDDMVYIKDVEGINF